MKLHFIYHIILPNTLDLSLRMRIRFHFSTVINTVPIYIATCREGIFSNFRWKQFPNLMQPLQYICRFLACKSISGSNSEVPLPSLKCRTLFQPVLQSLANAKITRLDYRSVMRRYRIFFSYSMSAKYH